MTNNSKNIFTKSCSEKEKRRKEVHDAVFAYIVSCLNNYKLQNEHGYEIIRESLHIERLYSLKIHFTLLWLD